MRADGKQIQKPPAVKLNSVIGIPAGVNAVQNDRPDLVVGTFRQAVIEARNTGGPLTSANVRPARTG